MARKAAIWQEGRKLASKSFEHTYLNSYVAHAPMETHTALAQVEGGKATVWASTQNPFGAQRRDCAGARFVGARMSASSRRSWAAASAARRHNPQAVEAARLAKAAGKPVQVMWSRAEEFFYDTFRPAAIVKISSGIDDAGKMRLLGLRGLLRRASAARHSSTPFPITAPRRTAAAGRDRRARILSPPAPGARRATTPTPSPANRRSTSWPPRRAWTRSSSASRTSPMSG